MFRDQRFTPAMAQDEVKHDAKTGQFTSGKGNTYTVETQANGRHDIKTSTGERVGAVSGQKPFSAHHSPTDSRLVNPVKKPWSSVSSARSGFKNHAIKALIEHHESSPDSQKVNSRKLFG